MFEIPRLTVGLFTKPRGQEEALGASTHTQKKKAPNYSKFPAPWGPESLCVRVVKGLWLLGFAPPLLLSHKALPWSSIPTLKLQSHGQDFLRQPPEQHMPSSEHISAAGNNKN